MRYTTVCTLSLVTALCSSSRAQEPEHASPKRRAPPAHLEEHERGAVELFQRVLPSVVTLFTKEQVRTESGAEEHEGIGSGVLISPGFHVLTAAHVVQGAQEIVVKTEDGVLRPAEVLYSEAGADVALVLLTGAPPGLAFAGLGDSDRLAVGQEVYVVGAPFGLENSFSVGRISGFREFNRLYDGTILAEFIQTDAAINSGNSGGPVFDSSGEVIGISSRILTVSGGSQGLGFVVAINTAKELLALEERPWVGIESIYLNREQLATLFQLDYDGALLVQAIVKGSPAEKAGLRPGAIAARIEGVDLVLGGDLILELGHQEACHTECLVRAANRIRGLDLVPVKFLREGKVMETVIDVSGTRRSFLR